MTSSNTSSLVLIDGMNFLWRSFSVPFRFKSGNGTPLHVATMFLKLLRNTYQITEKTSKHKNINFLCLFDTPTSTQTRKESYAQYKANRRKFAEDEETPYQYLDQIYTVLNFLDLPYHKCKSYEADDAIAYLSRNHIQRSYQNKSHIFSTDTDFYQILNKQISQVRFKRGGDYEIVTPKVVKERLQIKPKDYVYYKALKGDSSDNIEGIPGIGKVRAAKIINKEMDFDLEEYKKILDRNRKLIKFREDIEIADIKTHSKFKLTKLELNNSDIFRECGF